MCGWSTGVWDKITAYQKVSGGGTKNFALKDFQIAPNYGENGSAITSPARLIYLDNVIEPFIGDIRCIQHLQATTQTVAINLPITGLETRRCASLDMPNITFDGGQYGWVSDYTGTGGGSINGRIGRVFAFNQQQIGVLFGNKSIGNIVQSIESYVESNQGVGQRVGLRFDGPESSSNLIVSSSFDGPFLSAGVQMQNGCGFNRISGAASADCSAGGAFNRWLGFFGSIYDVGTNNEFTGGPTPLSHGRGATLITKAGVKTTGTHSASYSLSLASANVDVWLNVANFIMQSNSVAQITISAFGDYGGTPRITNRTFTVSRNAGTQTAFVENTDKLYQLNSLDRFDVRVTNDTADGSTKVQVRRTTLMGVPNDMTSSVKIDLDFDIANDAVAYAGLTQLAPL